MIVVPDALPKALAEDLRNRFIAADYKQHHQVNKAYYASGEEYMCRFKRSSTLEREHPFTNAGQEICQLLERIGAMKDRAEFFAYKMTDGDFFRVHDDSSNGLGLILYLSARWEWDWGGILMVDSGDGYTAYKPRFNQLVVVEPKGTKHFVTRVADYAQEPRYAMVGFIK
jgi:Rps23 Pro-64 3,4-dihydroxylase Tpa1-like proline 4-hydroxylase